MDDFSHGTSVNRNDEDSVHVRVKADYRVSSSIVDNRIDHCAICTLNVDIEIH